MKLLLIRLACATLLAVSLPSWADLSRDDAAAVAQRASGGRVLQVERAQQDNRPVWRVKVLTARGEVRVLLIDATSGRPL
jgi:uncharacterized membrane protein YkoI